MRNALQEQLLKAGLAKKSKVDQVAREQARQRHGKAPPPAEAGASPQAEAEQARQARVERDRALAAERNEQARLAEQRAQARQIIEQSRLPAGGDSEYRFSDGAAIRSVLVTAALRPQLARGAVVVVREGDSYALVPRAAADKILPRDPSMVVVDHGRGDAPASDAGEDPYYDRFKVPDDLIW